jgi:hypothetical protein
MLQGVDDTWLHDTLDALAKAEKQAAAAKKSASTLPTA